MLPRLTGKGIKSRNMGQLDRDESKLEDVGNVQL